MILIDNSSLKIVIVALAGSPRLVYVDNSLSHLVYVDNSLSHLVYVDSSLSHDIPSSTWTNTIVLVATDRTESLHSFPQRYGILITY